MLHHRETLERQLRGCSRCHRRRIPDRPKERGLDVGRQPRDHGVGVHDPKLDVGDRHDGPLGDGVDADGKEAPVLAQNPDPPVLVERNAVGGVDALCVGDVLQADRGKQVLLDERLQPEEHAQRVILTGIGDDLSRAGAIAKGVSGGGLASDRSPGDGVARGVCRHLAVHAPGLPGLVTGLGGDIYV